MNVSDWKRSQRTMFLGDDRFDDLPRLKKTAIHWGGARVRPSGYSQSHWRKIMKSQQEAKVPAG